MRGEDRDAAQRAGGAVLGGGRAPGDARRRRDAGGPGAAGSRLGVSAERALSRPWCLAGDWPGIRPAARC